ncbi:MAG: two-component system sensor histidine kinase BaeS [Candidatus Paceibacteria bacterium]|jgi:two-component system sensor histidine kinase BaeS
MRVSLRTRFFLTIAMTCVVVALAVSWASRRAASEGFRILYDGGEKPLLLESSTDGLHSHPGLQALGEPHPAELHKEAQTTFDRSLLLAIVLIGTAALVATLLLSRWIVGPVERLNEQARRLGEGEEDLQLDTKRGDELGELGRTMTQLAKDLASTEDLRRSLVHDVAHELRTPLTAMRGQIEALQDGLLPSNPETLDRLHSSVLQLGRIVDDLQELALAEAGQLSMQMVRVDLGQAIRSLLRSQEETEQKSSVEIEFEVLPEVWADVGRVRQVLSNLISNARRHGPADQPIRIRAQLSAQCVELLVCDDGPGIDAQNLERVFERFFRVDSSRERRTGGVGLGLPIARRLAEAMGGGLRLESPEGQGVTAIFRLPRADNSPA